MSYGAVLASLNTSSLEFLPPRNQWIYALHVSRLPDNSWVCSICGWHPGSTVATCMEYDPWRSAGRPRIRWDDTIAFFVRSRSDDSQHTGDIIPESALPDFRQLSDAFAAYSNVP